MLTFWNSTDIMLIYTVSFTIIAHNGKSKKVLLFLLVNKMCNLSLHFVCYHHNDTLPGNLLLNWVCK